MSWFPTHIPLCFQLTEEQLIEKKIANSRKLTPEECLFCGHFSENFDL